MRHKDFQRISEKNSIRGKISQENQFNERLEMAAKYEPIRSTESTLIFVVSTYNPISGQSHNLQIRHDIDNGNNRNNIYLNGVKWRNQWSRWRFVNWLYDQIDSVINDWH